ncbi:C4b-binding protein alpha chain-like isoform X1 [Anarrhichthys ocellatus]|uniref:C4b-binding protein alpha chain-like isoform X1 n=1 Tax=Anarrhichthys ocellatus TaxID=433405 RepID=UPI0012ECCF39|nr:C4b-binding protein alpha chain-like isoform X1 [Anarrhichthys ocellatus]
MSVAYFLLLSSLALAINAQAQNCSAPVGGANMGLKGSDILLKTFPNGLKVSFACDTGYITRGGSPIITCTDGSWSPVNLKCEIRSCGNAGEVANGHVGYPEGSDFGAKLEVTCKPGHRLVGRSLNIICGAEGWHGRLPECEVVNCSPPDSVVAGTFSPIQESYHFQQVVQFSCDNDYTLDGPKSLSCSEDGTFNPAPPTCVSVQCKDPDIKNAAWDGGSRPPHKYMSTVTYRCVSGYTMKGERTLTCGVDGQWLPGLPTCERTTGLDEKPHNNGNLVKVLVIVLAVIVIVLVIVGLVIWRLRAINKRRSGRSYPDNAVPKEGEEVALS